MQEFDRQYTSDDFFKVLEVLIPIAIENSHACYEQVLIKDGVINEGKHDREKAKDGIYAREFKITNESDGKTFEKYAFEDSTEIENLNELIKEARREFIDERSDSQVEMNDDFAGKIIIEHFFFGSGIFINTIDVKKYRDGLYTGSLNVKYEKDIVNNEEVKRILKGVAAHKITNYNKLFKKVEDARTNNQKKESLEEFIAMLIKELPGCEVKYTNKRGTDSEIDYFVINESEDKFLEKLDNPIIVECKHWKGKIGAREIRNFEVIILEKKAKTGIMVSLKGVTGRANKDANAAIKKAFSAGIVIIVLDENDLKKTLERKPFYEILRDKYYELGASI